VVHIGMPVSDPEHANTDTALKKRPASIHSAIANSTSITDFVAGGHCTGILTAAPEIQAALT
jgi:hypothetical protein